MAADGMTGVKIEIDLAAPPAKVYEAIATAAGVTSWWSDGTFAEEVGGVGRLAFGSGWTDLRVDKLVPDREVEWSCVGQSIPHFDPTDEWVGTRITFLLEPRDAGAGTHLTFTHHGLAGLDCAELCTRGWDHYIRTSLRGLVETGRGAAGPGAARGRPEQNADGRRSGEMTCSGTLAAWPRRPSDRRRSRRSTTGSRRSTGRFRHCF